MKQTLLQLAEAYRLRMDHGTVHGYVSGCSISITADDHSVCLSLHMGGQALTDVSHRRCEAALAIIERAAAEGRLHLAASGRHSPAIRLSDETNAVTVCLSPDRDAIHGIGHFFAADLPELTQLVRPMHCHCCGQPTDGAGCPVLLEHGVIVPIHIACLGRMVEAGRVPPTRKRRYAYGIAGGAAGMITGVLLCMLIGNILPAGYGGLIIALLVIVGYRLRGSRGPWAAVIIAVCIAAGILLACAYNQLAPAYRDYTALGTVARQMMSFPAFLHATRSMRISGGFFWQLIADVCRHAILAAGGAAVCAVVPLLRRRAPAAPRPLSGRV